MYPLKLLSKRYSIIVNCRHSVRSPEAFLHNWHFMLARSLAMFYFLPSLPARASGNRYFRNRTEVELCSICPPVTGLFHLALCPRCSPMLSHIAEFKAQWYSIVCSCHIFFVHSSIIVHLGRCHILAIMNRAAMNIGVLIFFWDPNFNSFG